MILTTRLNTVVVYPDRARLTRKGEVELTTGLHRLEISDLPVRLLPDSARVSAHGSARARLQGLQVQRAFYQETPAEQVRELEAQVEAAHDELEVQAAQIEAINRQRAQLDALAGNAKVYAKALAAGTLSVDDQMALYDRLRRRTGELNAEAQELERQKRQVERRLKQLQQQLDQARSLRPRERYTALVEVEVLQPGELTFELSYVVTGAGWSPLYDLRLSEDPQNPSLEVGYLAQVMQNSGEDWKDVALTLSTARPALAAAIPELKPWYIQPFQPPRPMAAPPGAQQMKALRANLPQAELPQAMPAPAHSVELFDADEAVAAVETSGASVTYAIPGTASIPPDGAEHKVVIARYPLSPALDYVTAPVMVPAVYRRAKVTNASAYTLLPGKVNLFAGDEFLGTTSLELTAPSGEIELFLGVDDRVKVERELVRREVDKTIIGGKRRLHYGYEIKLENLLPTSTDVLVRDRFPVARHEDIKVRLESSEPRPAEQSELNELSWTLTLAPGGKRTLRFDFVIEYPQAMELTGLEDSPSGPWPRY